MRTYMSRRDFIKATASAGILMRFSGNYLFGKRSISNINYDLILKKGTIIDGISDQTYKADVGIKGERITAITSLQNAKSKSIIDASDKIISPGFIDVHSHTDLELLANPKAESKIRQGVTTELSGNCGGSAFPRKKDLTSYERKMAERLNLNIDWTNLEEYHSRLARQGTAVNHATLVGHGTLRSFVMGEENREPNTKEMEVMKNLVAEAMQQGAFGLSTGLEYTPSGFAEPMEVIELCKAAAKYGGFYATHIRSEDHQVIEAVAESIYTAEKGELPLQISHFKAAASINWWKMPMMIDLIERAKERGLSITADRYPYTAYSTGLSVFFPQWALDGGAERFVDRLKNKELRNRMRKETLEKFKGYSWEDLVIVDVQLDKNKGLIGKNISEAATESKQDPYEFLCDLLIEEDGDVDHVGFAMSNENTDLVLQHQLVMMGSDGSALAPYGQLSRGVPHPRNYGAFPRFLRLYVNEKKTISLSEAIKKITSMPAAKMRLQDRGSIKEGNFADIVVFNPQTIADKATYTRPEQYPVGIDYVIVNGKIVIDDGKHTGELPGKVLQGSGKKQTFNREIMI
jgi:N-acyl-D-amino-acid deacylase